MIDMLSTVCLVSYALGVATALISAEVAHYARRACQSKIQTVPTHQEAAGAQVAVVAEMAALARTTSEKARTPVASELAWKSAAEHADALLNWLQTAGGLTGEIAARDLQDIYENMTADLGWAARPWEPVAKQLRLLIGGSKTYAYRDGVRVRVYRIPPIPLANHQLKLAA